MLFITSTAVETPWEPYALSYYERMLRAARRATSLRHSIVEHGADADYILFVGSPADGTVAITPPLRAD